MWFILTKNTHCDFDDAHRSIQIVKQTEVLYKHSVRYLWFHVWRYISTKAVSFGLLQSFQAEIEALSSGKKNILQEI